MMHIARLLFIATLLVCSPAARADTMIDTAKLTAWIDTHTNSAGRVNKTPLLAFIVGNAVNATPDAVTPPPTGDLQPTGPTGTMTLVFDEEFDKPLDPAVWNKNWLGAPGTVTKPINSAELAAYDPAQVAVINGMLELSAIAKTVTVGGKSYAYVSGMIESASRKEWTRGIFEFRATMPNWGAGWLNGHHKTWPDQGENDIVEAFMGAHYHAPGVDKGYAAPAGFDWAAFNVFTCEWQPGRIDWWYNGVHVGTQTTGVLATSQYMIFNHALSTLYGAKRVRVPSKMQVDWFRVYLRD